MKFNIFSEILRIIDSVQMTDSHKVATPADWKVSDLIVPLDMKLLTSKLL